MTWYLLFVQLVAGHPTRVIQIEGPYSRAECVHHEYLPAQQTWCPIGCVPFDQIEKHVAAYSYTKASCDDLMEGKP